MKPFLFALLFVAFFTSAAAAATFTVTNTNDSGAGSLRQAITDSNAAQNADVINFAIPASDPNCSASTSVCTIAPASPLPQLVAPVTINGYTQAGASANTAAVGTNAVLTVEIAGTQPGAAVGNGLTISSSSCSIVGLVINRFEVGVVIAPPAPGRPAEPDGISFGAFNHVEGCFIGTAPDGTTARGNNYGIRLSGGATSNVIGGAALAARNLISGNTFSFGLDIRDNGTNNNQVLNNLIGTTRTGNAALGNGGGVLIQNGAANNQIGTDLAGAGNVISGNNINVRLANDTTTGNSINGNLIGTNATGTAALSNAGAVGIEFFQDPHDNNVGSGSEGARNIISGHQNGVVVTGSGNRINSNYIGTNAAGTAAIPNTQSGIELRGASNTEMTFNTISGNGAYGILLNGNFGANNANFMLLNRIGVDNNGDPLGNGQAGIGLLPSNASQNVIGGQSKGALGNIIANNGAGGIALGSGGEIRGNEISLNSIYNNTGLGIVMPTANDNCDEDDGPNRAQNHPILTSASLDAVIQGTLNSGPNRTYRIEFFSNPSCDASGFGEGRTWIGSRTVTTNANCQATFNVDLDATLQAGQSVSATATDVERNDTSGFSPCIEVTGGVAFNPSTYQVNENAGSVTLTVTRSGDTSGALTVLYTTVDGSAKAEMDYNATFGALTFAPNETTKTFSVQIIDDSAVEGNESFTAVLTPDIGDRGGAGTNGGGVPVLSTATVTIIDNDAAPTPTPPTVQLSNISGRALVQTSAKVGICGFIINGGSGKKVIVRGIGPSLRNAPAPISNALNDPRLDLYNSSGTVIFSNNDWRSTQESMIQQSGLAPSDDREAAIVATLQPGAYTAIVMGANNSSGVGLVEVYELQSDQGQLANVSVRGDVLTNDNVLINGIILNGGAAKRILFRAIGPDLHNRGITGELQDPRLDIYNANGVNIGSNDNWPMSTQAAEIVATGLQPNDIRESAVILTLNAGNYTAIVSGVNSTTGIALAEAFRLD